MSEPRLTLKDPIKPEILHRLAELTHTRAQVAERFLDMELEKVKLFVTAKELEAEKNRVLGRELQERGINSDTPIEVDGNTGVITLLTSSE